MAPRRFRPLVATLVLHAVVVAVLWQGYRVEPRSAAAPLVTLAVEPPPPPPIPPTPQLRPVRADTIAASPPASASAPPVVIPPPLVEIPSASPPAVTATVPGVGVAGDAVAGVGAAGIGAGLGGNGSGDDGLGDGEGFVPPRHRRGRLSRSDLPPTALGGRTTVRYRIGTDGRVSDCRITVSSGDAMIDATTCRLITERFVFRPARDGRGRVRASYAEETHRWAVE